MTRSKAVSAASEWGGAVARHFIPSQMFDGMRGIDYPDGATRVASAAWFAWHYAQIALANIEAGEKIRAYHERRRAALRQPDVDGASTQTGPIDSVGTEPRNTKVWTAN